MAQFNDPNESMGSLKIINSREEKVIDWTYQGNKWNSPTGSALTPTFYIEGTGFDGSLYIIADKKAYPICWGSYGAANYGIARVEIDMPRGIIASTIILSLFYSKAETNPATSEEIPLEHPIDNLCGITDSKTLQRI